MLTSFIEKTRNSHLVRNTFWMLLGQGARLPIQAVYFIMIARALGAQGYGAFVGVTALIAILAPFASLGSGNILIKHVSRDESSFNLYWGKALALTFFSGFFFVIIAVMLSKVLLPVTITFALILTISLADLIFSRLLDISVQAFQAFQKLDRTSLLMVLPNVVRLLFLAGLLLLTPNPSATLWGYFYCAGILLSALIGLYLVKRELGSPILNKHCILSEIKEGFYFSVSLSSQNIYNDIDKTMIARISSLEAAGIYGAAYRIIDVSFTPIRSLLYASYTRFFQSGISGIRGTHSFAVKLLPFAVGYSFAASFLLYFAAPILPYLLGSDYLETVSALRWLSLLPLLKSLHYFAADALTGAGFQGTRSLCQIAMALLNIALVLWLIPKYSWVGAAWASIVTDFTLVIAMWSLVFWLRKQETHTKPISTVVV